MVLQPAIRSACVVFPFFFSQRLEATFTNLIKSPCVTLESQPLAHGTKSCITAILELVPAPTAARAQVNHGTGIRNQ